MASMRPFNDRLADFAHMRDGWDGHGSKAPTDDAIRTAANLVPVPGGDGSIQVEMHAGGADIEIEIAPDGTVKSVLWARST